MRRIISFIGGAAALMFGGMLAMGLAHADGNKGVEKGFTCSAKTLKGTYGIQMQGTRPVPPALGGGVESVIGVVIRTYDGIGSFSQTDNIKGAVTGIAFDRPGHGTYEVNADCTAIIQLSPAPGVLIEERMVIVRRGDELRSITASPLPNMISTVQLRIDRR
jgi:hypothetical protein